MPSKAEKIRDILKQLNELIDDTIKKYRKGTINEDELRERIEQMKKLKFDAMDNFPEIYGWKFSVFYLDFWAIDLFLERVSSASREKVYGKDDLIRWLEHAKREKKSLLERVPKKIG